MKIEFNLEIETPIQIEVLLRDALSEFIATRTPIDEYLDKRYGREYVDAYPEKITEIIERIRVARLMLDSQIEVRHSFA